MFIGDIMNSEEMYKKYFDFMPIPINLYRRVMNFEEMYKKYFDFIDI